MMPTTSMPRRLLALVLGCAVLAGAARAADLSELRAQRRAAVRAAVAAADKAGGGAPFGLLVIPVDFADARVPAGWQAPAALGPRLQGEGQTLRRYFTVASGGACDLDITLAPLISLPGTRRDYSDVGLNGFTRTRQLAREAIGAVAASGLDLRRLDNDGPDGVAGTADDDGQVDGVLILHAGIGQENDVEAGLVQPLQYFLDEPVTAGGVSASFYAVAAMRSGLGIWAHETAHLLGLEERYDLRYAAAGESEVHSRGGLGIFSLMAAGAWGTGGGANPALPDAYSRWQLGWCRAVDLPAAGTVDTVLTPLASGGAAHRVWTHGRPDGEFFLLEVRAPVDGFDAAVPAGQLVVYHVDESVPEAAWSDVGEIHLRVNLVEADGDGRLAAGLDEGSAADLFPGTTGATAFGPGTTPDSDGYTGPSHVALAGITPRPGDPPAVAYTVSAAAGPAVAVDLAFQGADPATLALAVVETGAAAGPLTATVAAAYPPLGAFAGGGTERTLALVETAPGRWTPATPPAWQPDPDLPPDAATRFVVTVGDGAWTAEPAVRTWAWRDNAGVLDFAGAWPGAWTIDHPDGDLRTTWHRWDDASPAVPAGAHLLACVADRHAGGAAWPDVAYDNGAHATLTSGLLGPGVTAVALVHAWDTERLAGDTFMDGAAAFWVGPGGEEIPAVPVDGFPGRIEPRSLAALHGRPAWGGGGDLAADGRPVWRRDVLPAPDAGPGPWRLRLVFAANTRDWNHRGWLVAGFEVLTATPPASAVPVAWGPDGLAWDWPDAADGGGLVTVQRRDGDGAWRDLLTQPHAPAGALPAAVVLAALPGGERDRSVLRVVGPLGAPLEGVLASGPVVVFPDGGDGRAVTFGLPWPNPATGGVRCLLTVPDGGRATLGVYDLRGRLVASWDYPAGEHLALWDGRDRGGRRAAAGTYILRLDGPDGILTHKVVLLH